MAPWAGPDRGEKFRGAERQRRGESGAESNRPKIIGQANYRPEARGARPGATYSLLSAGNLSSGTTLNGNIPSGGEVTVESFTTMLLGEPRGGSSQ